MLNLLWILMIVLVFPIFIENFEGWTLVISTIINVVVLTALKGVDVEKSVLVEILKAPIVLQHGGQLVVSQR